MKSELLVIKIGGQVIEDESVLSQVLQQFAHLSCKKILVHGGGALANQLAEKLGHPQMMIEGRRVTDIETLKLTTMVYGGFINKNIVAKLYTFGCHAIGVTGADGDLIRSKKRAPNPVDYGWVGDIQHVNLPRLMEWLDAELIPVVAPLTHDGKGNLLNTNADTIANKIATSLSEKFSVTLIYSFEKSGVLLDIDDESSRVAQITSSEFSALKKEGKIFAGMIPKLDNAFQAIQSGVQKVILGKAVELNQLIQGTAGTTLVKEKRL